jgi:hypothetical protein
VGNVRHSAIGAEKKNISKEQENGNGESILIYEYKLDISTIQEAAIKEAIQVAQFIGNKCLHL